MLNPPDTSGRQWLEDAGKTWGPNDDLSRSKGGGSDLGFWTSIRRSEEVVGRFGTFEPVWRLPSVGQSVFLFKLLRRD